MVLRGARLDEQRADAVAIDAEILVAALGGDDFVAGRQKPAQAARVLVQPAPEALIGYVDEGKQPALGNDAGHLRPLLVVEVGARRIVTAAMQQDDVARLRLLQRSDHRIETDAARVAVVIGIFDLPQADGMDDRRMVGPGRGPD